MDKKQRRVDHGICSKDAIDWTRCMNFKETAIVSVDYVYSVAKYCMTIQEQTTIFKLSN